MSSARALACPVFMGRAMKRRSRQGIAQSALNPLRKLLIPWHGLIRAHLSTKSSPVRNESTPGHEDWPPGYEDEEEMSKGPITGPPVHFHMEVSIVPGGLQFVNLNKGPKLRRDFLPSFWLRDSCFCPGCVNPDTEQRMAKTFEISPTIRPIHIKFSPGAQLLIVRWGDRHVSRYSFDFLNRYLHADHPKISSRNLENYMRKNLWDCHGVEDSQVLYSEVMADDTGLFSMLAKIHRNGYVLVNETPYDSAEPTKELLERIAFIRLTHYGGFYDFIPDLALADTAYTNLALTAHTDTTYFSDPAGLQAFHLLSHHPAARGEDRDATGDLGGKSLLVDGFRTATLLKQSHPWAYNALRCVRLPWHASGNKGITIAPDKYYPVFELDDAKNLHKIRWNNDDRGVVPLNTPHMSVNMWFRAARIWNTMLEDPVNQFWLQLKPGTVLIFDNWRVLHGRSAFTGTRRICGGYINRDDYISRWRNFFHASRARLMSAVRG